MGSEEVVMRDSAEAAQWKTGISGWVSRHGRFYGDNPDSEQVARFDGCTHVKCIRCGEPVQKGWTACSECRSKRNMEKFLAMLESEWDGKAMLYSETEDRYFPDAESAEEFADDEGGTVNDLRLVICEPVYTKPLDPDYFSDDLPEDGDLPQTVEDAVVAFNKAVEGVVLSWVPGKARLRLKAERPAEGPGGER